MKFSSILPLTRGRLDVLFEIYAEKGGDYLRNISKRLKMNPSLAFNILNKLYKEGFLERQKRGKEVQYNLVKDRDLDILIKLIEEYHLEKILRKSGELKTAVKLLINNREILDSSHKVYIFGSYVLGNFTKKSDLDILFVNEKRKLVGRVCREISLISGIETNPLIYSKKRFENELAKNEPLLSSIINNIKNRAVIK